MESLLSSVVKYGNILGDKNQPLKNKFRALFYLRNIPTDESVNYIIKAFYDDSTLLKHELAYCLGQMKNPLAIPHLTNILQDKDIEPIIRHEAGEALGAIASNDSLETLKLFMKDSNKEVAETCVLAYNRIMWLNNHSDNYESDIFKTIDPAPPFTDNKYKNLDILKATFLDSSVPLFVKYRAMFTLRNLYCNEAVLILTKGLEDEISALFRHEVAYVLGQLQNPISIESLHKTLANNKEVSMVRHECAEALGSIGTCECKKILYSFLSDTCEIVRESCEIAIDMVEQEHKI